jgi:CBS domain-containing protein
MTRSVVAVREHAEFKEILHILRAREFSAFPVLDADDKVIGVVAEDDLLVKQAYNGPDPAPILLLHRGDRARADGLTAAELMSKPAITIGPEATIAEAARTMHTRHVRRLPVVSEDGRLAGIVSRVDLLGSYDRPDEDIRQEILEKIISAGFMLDTWSCTVSVRSGIVTLSGPVDSEALALSLLDAIRHIDGVVALRDRLHYPPDSPAPAGQSAGRYGPDAEGDTS